MLIINKKSFHLHYDSLLTDKNNTYESIQIQTSFVNN